MEASWLNVHFYPHAPDWPHEVWRSFKFLFDFPGKGECIKDAAKETVANLKVVVNEHLTIIEDFAKQQKDLFSTEVSDLSKEIRNSADKL